METTTYNGSGLKNGRCTVCKSNSNEVLPSDVCIDCFEDREDEANFVHIFEIKSKEQILIDRPSAYKLLDVPSLHKV